MFWKRQLPLAIAFIAGVVFAIQYFVPHRISQTIFEWYTDWAIIIATFGAILGFYSIVRLHSNKIRRKVPGWFYSVITLACMLSMVLGAIIGGQETGSFFSNMYNYVFVPISATMFSLLGFYIASASYRAFRARTAKATGLLLAAVIVMLGRVPLGQSISFWTKWNPNLPSLVDIANWIMDVPNMASKRAIALGVALGMMLVSLKIILGIERTYLGGGD
ncbi:hypothetical protein JW877_00710 [bacterium]|nr:hypothetical protein [bacterium]